jgi:hypothetical protein
MITIQFTGIKEFEKVLQDRMQQFDDLGNTEIRVVSEAEYSGYVDQGTRYMDAQPFFQETVEEYQQSFAQELESDLTADKARQIAENMVNDMKSKAPVDTGYLQDNIHVE